MRVLLGLLLAVAPVDVGASPAAAKCVRATVAENAARAVAVVYGTVTASGQGALTMRVDRVLQGQVGGETKVFVGPGRVGVPGAAAATSVDYPGMSSAAAVGSDHVLYLVRGGDGQLETSACTGSHSGPPDADELAFFATAGPSGTPQAPASAAPATPVVVHGDPSTLNVPISAIWPLLVLLLLAGAMLLVLRRRAARPR
jgi:hypothetical protein